MATISDYLTQLQTDKQTLVDNLVAKGVEATSDETFTSLVPKVLDVSGDVSEYFETSYSGTSPKYWIRNNYIKKIPDIIIDDSVETLEYFAYGATSLPKIVCNSNVKDMSNMYYNISPTVKNIDVSGLDTSNVTSMKNMFSNNSGLISIDLSNFDTSKVTTINSLFAFSTNIVSLDLSNFDTSNVEDSGFNRFVYSNSNLEFLNISSFDFGKATMFGTEIFYNCSKLKDLKFGFNIGKGYIKKTENYSNCSIKLSSCSNLTHDSLMSVINGLYDLNLTYDVANGGTLYTQQLTLGSTNLAKLTEEEIAIATNKGWTVS